jgi:hypothetical protein
MPAKDRYHDGVVDALKADGWNITNDPLYLAFGGRGMFADLGAEHETLAAEKDGQRVAVEIKSFISDSPVDDLEGALGSYTLYRCVLEETDQTRPVYLAVPEEAWKGIFSEPLGQLVINCLHLKLIVFDIARRSIVQWIN